jgi:hypothetical protein
MAPPLPEPPNLATRGQSDTIGANDLAAVADVAKESLGVHEYAATAGDRAGVRYPPGDASRPEEGAIIKINAPADFAGAAIDDAAKKGLDRFQKDVALHSTGVRNPAGTIAIPEDANIGYPNAPYRRRNFTAIAYPARESADGDNCDGALARGDCAAVDNTAAGAAVAENGDAEDLNAVPCRDRDLAAVADPPENVDTPSILIPPVCAAITLVFTMPPAKIVPRSRLMPRSEAVIVPVLVIPLPDTPAPKTVKRS